TEKFSNSHFVELYNAKAKIDLYANWIDRITVTKDNFTTFFKISSRWNGGLNAGGNAAINYSFEPTMAYDPELSAQSIEISVTPHIGSWSNGSNTISLLVADDYYYYGQKRIDSSAAGTQFQIGESTLSWTLITESFELQLLHSDPITIHLDLDGGECEKDSFDVEGGHKLLKSELPTPKKSGYRFMGWYSDSEFGTEYEERPITRERTLYAQFKKEVKVTFHSNGGTKKDDLDLLGGDLINISDPQREDYKFLGWYTDPNFANKLEPGARAEEADVDLYAKWAKIHTVTFETNGGSPVEALRVVDGDTPKINLVNTVKNSLSFMGWYTDPACEKKYEACPIDGDLTLYALWARTISLYEPSIDDLKQYINFEITEEYTTLTENRLIYNIRLFKITASIKEEYLRLGISIYG
ncbi:MAG: InlB B-repeat-containing protein, partial [Clostridiales bacterium]|nr:InlB B-repeat-containing protein [Clostridiales bacterium]